MRKRICVQLASEFWNLTLVTKGKLSVWRKQLLLYCR
jgi:hypothetical protein